MPIPFKLDDGIERVLRVDTPEYRMIHALTGVRLSNHEAQTAWHRVLEHKGISASGLDAMSDSALRL
jgi:hypothetical protein